MGYKHSPFAAVVVKNPGIVAAIVLAVGLLGGIAAAIAMPTLNLFERFGAVTTSLGLVVFGSLASELLVRSQGSFVMQDDGEPGGPFKFAVTRRALTLQTWVVLIGTLQWGFGSLVFAR